MKLILNQSQPKEINIHQGVVFSYAVLILCFYSLVYCVFGINSAIAANIAAFPGAEGFGSMTSGGRGGRVIEVINLNASGPGSFREACEASGSRIVVFRTGGTIEINNDIEIKNPYITIAGQTAPGDGICIKGAALRISTHDVIIRGLRIRVGDNPNGPDPEQRDGVGIDNPNEPTYNIIIDHCSVSWSLDENIATCWVSHDITFQWCIISEALLAVDDESYGLLVGDNSKNISVHHCLFAHNKDRSPLQKFNATSEVINNVIYNWRWYATRMYSGGNIIGNYYKPGPNWTGGKGIAVEDIQGIKIYVKDNIGPGRELNTQDDWLGVNAADTYRSTTSVMQPSGIITQDASEAYDLVLKNAGAVNPYRDTVDTRIIQSVKDGSGRIIWSQDEVGGWPVYNAGIPPMDTDHDGMPDTWESSYGLDPANPADGRENKGGDGYTNIEKYINSLIPCTNIIAAPTNLAATAQSASRIDLSWVASPSQAEVTGYAIYRDGLMVGTADSTSYQDTGLTAGLTYVYEVSAYNALSHESDKSLLVSVTTLVDKYELNTMAVNGSITRSPNQAMYQSGETVTLTATPNAGYVFSSWSGDVAGIINPVKITMNARKKVSAIFNKKAGTVPRAPSGLLATRVSDSAARLTWHDNSNNETGFIIERYNCKSRKHEGVAILKANKTRYRDTHLSKGIRYYYYMRAFNSAGKSSYSERIQCIIQ